MQDFGMLLSAELGLLEVAASMLRLKVYKRTRVMHIPDRFYFTKLTSKIRLKRLQLTLTLKRYAMQSREGVEVELQRLKHKTLLAEERLASCPGRLTPDRTPVRTGQEALWGSEPLWTVTNRKSCPAENRTPVVQPVA
jgi:hypothetical protein